MSVRLREEVQALLRCGDNQLNACCWAPFCLPSPMTGRVGSVVGRWIARYAAF
jgi:hypothetical protein